MCNDRLVPRANAILLVSAILLIAPSGVSAQHIRARVVDSASRNAVGDAIALLVSANGDTVATASSGADGFFLLTPPAPGTYSVVVRRLDYRTQSRGSVTTGSSDVVIPAFVMERAAIELPAITADAEREKKAPIAGSGRPSYVISGTRMAELERASVSPASALAQIGALRVRSIFDIEVDGRRYRDYTCVEAVRGTEMRGMLMPSRKPACRTVALVMNGILMGDPNDFWNSIRIAELESIEYISPMDAQMRYGARGGANGAVELWTRRSGPHKSKDRDVERQP